VRDGILHELHTPLRLCDMSTNHDARRITVDEANRVAGCDFDVACLWGKTDKSWVASWFRRANGWARVSIGGSAGRRGGWGAFSSVRSSAPFLNSVKQVSTPSDFLGCASLQGTQFLKRVG